MGSAMIRVGRKNPIGSPNLQLPPSKHLASALE
jgi:hypothetical protein